MEDTPHGMIIFGYDLLGRRTERKADGGEESFTYDKIGRVIRQTNPLASFAIEYLGQGDRPTAILPDNHVLDTYLRYGSPEEDRRLRAITHNAAFPLQAMDFLYQSDPEDRLVSATDIGGSFIPQVKHYQYDNTGRLTLENAIPGGLSTFLYDLADNITALQSPQARWTASYNNVNEVIKLGEHAYVYDANGNLTNDGLRTFAWDAENRLVKIGYLDDAKKNTTFRYDGLNRRAVMVEMNGSDNQTTTFLWDGTDLLVAKTGNLLKRYYPQGELHGNEKLFYVSDRLGSVRETVNQDCLITARMRYSAYGMTRTELPIFIGKTPDYRYAGLFFHEQSGLYLAVFRLYDPTSGRWISRDPIGEEGGINLFSYADNSPVTETDVAGLFSWSQINSSILDITGGCSESKRHFVGDVARNFIAVEKFSLLRLGVSLALSGKVADTYGGLTIGRALVEYYKETKTGLKVVSIGYRSFGQVAGTVAATTAFDSVLINGMYYAGALIGSVLRVAVNRVAASSCECSS